MYALASFAHRRSASSICALCAAVAVCQGVGRTPCICVLFAVLAAGQGVGYTPWRRLGAVALPVACARCVRHLALAKGSDVRRVGAAALPVACACCVWHLARQGVGCTPWRRLGAAALPVAFACIPTLVPLTPTRTQAPSSIHPPTH